MRLIFISFLARIFSILGWNVGEKLPRKLFNLALYFFGYRAIFFARLGGSKIALGLQPILPKARVDSAMCKRSAQIRHP